MVKNQVTEKRQRVRLATCSGGGLPRDTPLEGALWLRVYCRAKWPLSPGLEALLALAMLSHWVSSALVHAWRCWTSIRHGSSRVCTRCAQLGGRTASYPSWLTSATLTLWHRRCVVPSRNSAGCISW